MNLEEKVTEGRISYIDSIEHDPAERRLIIRFINDPEEQAIDRILIFSEVSDFSNELNWDPDEDENEDEDEEDEDCLDSLVGLQEYPDADGIRYQVKTEQRELVFLTGVAPRIENPPVEPTY
jgi:hypothetical protein